MQSCNQGQGASAMAKEIDRIWLPKAVMGQRVRELREQRLRLSQAALGAALGYAKDSAQGTIGQIEAGTRAMPDGKLLRLARMAEVPLSHFMESGTVDRGWQDGYLAAVHKMERALGSMRDDVTAGYEANDARRGTPGAGTGARDTGT